MTNTAIALRDLDTALAAVVEAQLRDGEVRGLEPDDLVSVMDAAASVVRRAEAFVGRHRRRGRCPVGSTRPFGADDDDLRVSLGA
ncbi:hypothetical protein ACFXQA_04225 [Microbacterium sp. P07]|uniref:hypothetical protein n=1 Tax=Microbacterium sp. P07 TaxID=3366952 RepID=UPI00374762D1